MLRNLDNLLMKMRIIFPEILNFFSKMMELSL